MTTVGIDAIDFYTPHYYLALADLASARGIPPEKYQVGLGQYQMAVATPNEDIVTMSANAALKIVSEIDISEIDTLLFATESGIDQAKAAGIYVHRLLNLPSACRVVELKQACYSTTAALQMASAWVACHPDKKVLVLAADIAKYALNSPAEPTQGAGAAAFLVSNNPGLLILEPAYGVYTEDVMDFWRPNYSLEARVEGKLSTMVYLRALEAAWKDYAAKTRLTFNDLTAFCYHTPLAKLVEKAHKTLLKIANGPALTPEQIQEQLDAALQYPRIIGNSYSAALTISLISLLENHQTNLAQKRIGCYSYGSGCVGEYFSMIVQDDYRQKLDTKKHHNFLDNRQKLSVQQYEDFYRFRLPQDGSDFLTPDYQTGQFKLTGIRQHKRRYESIS